jgi:hypothetical protein
MAFGSSLKVRKPQETQCKSADLAKATWKFQPSGWAAWE